MSERYEQSYKSLSRSLPIHEIKADALKVSKGYVQWIMEMKNKFLSEREWSELKVLELGGGTGGVGIHLMELGADVTLVDISTTALEIARELTQNKIKTIQADLSLPVQHFPEKYDLIIDSHLFHCITGDAERASYLATVKEYLNSEGILVGESMCFKKKLYLPPGYELGDDRILRQKLNEWIDLRKVADSLELEDEFKAVPFEILFFYYYHHYVFVPSQDFIAVPPDFLPASVRYVLSHDKKQPISSI
jgi:SAM-dependent methyltransferase